MSAQTPEIPADLLAELAAGDAEEAQKTKRFENVLEQAALVGFFDLDWLEKRAGGSPECKSAVLNASESLDASLNQWRLKASEREQHLQMLASAPDRLAKRLEQSEPLASDAVGQALQNFATSGSPPVDGDEATLEAMLEAATWLKDVEAIPSPEPRAIRRKLSRKRMLRRLEETSDRFVGRREQLEQLEAFADGPPTAAQTIPVLPVFGIGGIGKSALLSQLLHDRIHTTAPDEPSPLIFHLDFDRVGTASANPVEWSFELTRQLAFLVPAMAAELDTLRKQGQRAYANQYAGMASFPFRSGYSEDLKSQTESLESAVFSGDDVVSGLLDTLSRLAIVHRPLLMIFDTVEALQVYSVEGLLHLGSWIWTLREKAGFQDIRVVLSGRVEAMLCGSAFVKVEPSIKLDDLGDVHAIELLQKLQVGSQDAQRLVEEFGGNPLILRLIAQLAARQGIELSDLLANGDGRTKADKELVQGVLYHRILGHVSDKTVRELAHPGLAVRRVTEEVLQHVIAPLCLPQPLGEAEAARLYSSLAKEVWLVEPAPDGEGVVHRSDLRRLTMKLIARDEQETARVERIHRAAIAYYENGEGRHAPYAADEALYHRFMVPGSEMLPHLDRKTAQRARKAIGASLDELPRGTLVALHAALDEGVELDEALQLPDYLWARYVLRRGSELVQRDAFVEALALLNKRPLPAGAPVPVWLAVALDALARWDELFERLTENGWTEDQAIDRLNTWIAVGLKSGRLATRPAAKSLVERVLAVRGSVLNPVRICLSQYVARAGWHSPDALLSSTTSDLLQSPEVANEVVRYLQAVDRVQRFRPVHTQFYPSLEWLERLQRVAGVIAGPELAEFIEKYQQTEPARLVIGNYLGRLSLEFEAVWTDAFVRNAIAPEALTQLLEIREFPEFRTPIRVALLERFADAGALRDLNRAFGPALPVTPFDLAEPGLSRALSNPHEFVINLVAYADRCQRLYRLLETAGSLRASPRIEAVQLGMLRWFRPHEAQLHLKQASL